MNYKQGYYFLFNSLSDLIEELKDLQQKVEEIMILEPFNPFLDEEK